MPEPSKPSEMAPPLAESLPEEDLNPSAVASPRGSGYAQRSSLIQNEPEVDNALRQSRLESVRGNKSQAERTLRDAVIKFPTSGSLHESLGDSLAEQGKTSDALACYRRAQSCGAGAGIESKIARIALKQDPVSVGLTSNVVERGAGPVALIASSIIPGLGLALVGDFRNAAITFAGWLISTVLVLVIPPLREAIEDIMRRQEASGGATFGILFLSLISTAFWIYSLWLTWQVTQPAEKDGH